MPTPTVVRRYVPALALLLLAPAPAAAESGGTTAPFPGTGGATVGSEPQKAKPKPKRKRRAPKRAGRGPVLASFSVGRPRLFLLGHAAPVRFRIEARSAVRVRLAVAPATGGKAVKTIDLGERAPGRAHSFAMTGREEGTLAQGRYVVRIGARDGRGRRLRRAATASSSASFSFFHHRFPLAGRFGYGQEGSRFGAPRSGHRHQGQDLAAVEGTPVVAPRGGTVETVRYQASGAGHYVVLDGAGEDRDYVFMHLRSGSIPVREGQSVRTGQRLGEVGNTGRSFGAHLHFEIWVGGWYSRGGRPVDPLPLLRAWDAWS